MITDFKIFLNNTFETAEFLLIVGLTAILGLQQMKNSAFRYL